MRYVRVVKVLLGPLKFTSVFYTSQFLDRATIQMHCCERGGGHVVSRFRCVEHEGGTRVVYEELVSMGSLVLKLGASAIRVRGVLCLLILLTPQQTARQGHLKLLAEQLVARAAAGPVKSYRDSWQAASASSRRSTAITSEAQPETVEEEEFELPDEGHVFSGEMEAPVMQWDDVEAMILHAEGENK